LIFFETSISLANDFLDLKLARLLMSTHLDGTRQAEQTLYTRVSWVAVARRNWFMRRP
jgi:hypothetical protein